MHEILPFPILKQLHVVSLHGHDRSCDELLVSFGEILLLLQGTFRLCDGGALRAWCLRGLGLGGSLLLLLLLLLLGGHHHLLLLGLECGSIRLGIGLGEIEIHEVVGRFQLLVGAKALRRALRGRRAREYARRDALDILDRDWLGRRLGGRSLLEVDVLKVVLRLALVRLVEEHVGEGGPPDAFHRGFLSFA